MMKNHDSNDTVIEGHSKEFLLVEYAHLWKEIEQSNAELRSSEKWAVIATGAIWAWLATHQLQSGLSLVLWSPAALTLMLYLKSLAVKASIHRRGIYIHILEERADITKHALGWESFITTRKTDQRLVSYNWFSWWSHAYYGSMIIINAILAISGGIG